MRALVPACPPVAIALEHDDVEAFGGGVHRGGKARRAGADDDQIVHLRRIEVTSRPAHLRQSLDRRTAQEPALAPDHDRRVRRRNAELAQQLLGLLVALRDRSR